MQYASRRSQAPVKQRRQYTEQFAQRIGMRSVRRRRMELARLVLETYRHPAALRTIKTDL